MGRKRSTTSKRNLDQMLADGDKTAEQTTTTTQSPTLSMKNSDDNPNTSQSTSHVNQSNSSHNDTNVSVQTSLVPQLSADLKTGSKVWLYAKKSENGQQASCLLCDFVCSSRSHSTSTIRQHLISKHAKHDLIIPPTNANIDKPNISDAFKKELNQLCYYAIIKDGQTFNDLNKIGIKTLIGKLYPGTFLFLLEELFVLFPEEQLSYRAPCLS